MKVNTLSATISIAEITGTTKNTGMRFPLIFTSGRNTIESIVPVAAITDNTIAAVIISSSNEKALYSHFEKFATIIA